MIFPAKTTHPIVETHQLTDEDCIGDLSARKDIKRPIAKGTQAMDNLGKQVFSPR
jgi:hypothetical protein